MTWLLFPFLVSLVYHFAAKSTLKQWIALSQTVATPSLDATPSSRLQQVAIYLAAMSFAAMPCIFIFTSSPLWVNLSTTAVFGLNNVYACIGVGSDLGLLGRQLAYRDANGESAFTYVDVATFKQYILNAVVILISCILSFGVMATDYVVPRTLMQAALAYSVCAKLGKGRQSIGSAFLRLLVLQTLLVTGLVLTVFYRVESSHDADYIYCTRVINDFMTAVSVVPVGIILALHYRFEYSQNRPVALPSPEISLLKQGDGQETEAILLPKSLPSFAAPLYKLLYTLITAAYFALHYLFTHYVATDILVPLRLAFTTSAVIAWICIVQPLAAWWFYGHENIDKYEEVYDVEVVGLSLPICENEKVKLEC